MNNSTTINPKVSTWIHNRFPRRGEELKIIDLYTVMKQCEQILPETNKGESGSIFPYLSEEANPSYFEFDGVVFVDIDNCQNVSNKIFESFDKLCEAMPNLLAMNFSYSRNLHCYFYDKEIKENPSKYGEKAMLYLCAFAAAVRKITDIDLRKFEGALDAHSTSPNQRLFLNHSEFKWNIYCCNTTIGNEDVKRLKSEIIRKVIDIIPVEKPNKTFSHIKIYNRINSLVYVYEVHCWKHTWTLLRESNTLKEPMPQIMSRPIKT